MMLEGLIIYKYPGQSICACKGKPEISLETNAVLIVYCKTCSSRIETKLTSAWRYDKIEFYKAMFAEAPRALLEEVAVELDKFLKDS